MGLLLEAYYNMPFQSTSAGHRFQSPPYLVKSILVFICLSFMGFKEAKNKKVIRHLQFSRTELRDFYIGVDLMFK